MGGGHQRLAGRGGYAAAIRAIQHRQSHLSFQRLELLTDGWRSDMRAVIESGASVAAVASEERPDLVVQR